MEPHNGLSELPANRTRIRLSLNGQPLPVIGLFGTEAISAAFHFELQVLLQKSISLTSLIGANAQLELIAQDNSRRLLAGLITAAAEDGSHDDGRLLIKLTLASRLSLLHHQTDWRVLLNLSIPEIIRVTLQRHGFSAQQIRFALSQHHPAQPFTLQAGETDFDFILRLAARDGLFFWSEEEEGREVVVFADHNSHCPYLDGGVVEYRPPDGLPTLTPGKTHLGLHRMQITANWISERYQLHDRWEETPAVRLTARADRTDAARTRQNIFGPGTRSIEQTETLARRLAERGNVEAWHMHVAGNLSRMATAHLFSLDASRFDPRQSGDMLITALTHHARQGAGEHVGGEDTAYRCEAILIKRETPYRSARPPLPELPLTFTARIESDGHYARLDEQGRYRLRTHFDRSGKTNTQASPPLRKLQPLGGPPREASRVGFHFPLRAGTEILLSCLNNDPDRPMIVGSLPNADTPGPVTARNKPQNILRTAAGNELRMDDTQEREAVTLQTFNGHNMLHLDLNAMGHKIRLASEHGTMQLFAREVIKLHCGGTLTERVGDARTQLVENAHRTETKQADIHHQANTDIRHTAHDTLRLHTGNNTEFKSGQHLRIKVRNNARLTLQGSQGMILSVKGGELTLQAANDIRITGKGGGDITFEQSGAGFKIDPAGNVHLWGQNVQLGGDGGVSFGGPVNWNIGSPVIPAAAPVSAPLALTPLPSLDEHGTEVAEENAATLELEYAYQDGAPVVGAPFEVTFADGQRVQGTLDNAGHAALQAPVAGPVDITLGEDARDWTPNEPPESKAANPHQQTTLDRRGADTLVARMEKDTALRQLAEENDPGIATWIWGVLQGDFNENPTTTQTVVASVITMIPVIDQVADARDILANVITLSEEEGREDPMNWIFLVITLIGLFPMVGSALKGVFKIIIKNLDTGLDTVLALLRKLGKGDPLRLLRQFDWAGRRTEIRRLFDDALARLQHTVTALRESKTIRLLAGEQTLEQLARISRQLDAIREAGQKKVDEAIDLLKARVDAVLHKAEPKRRARAETGDTTRIRTHELDLPYEPHHLAIANGPKVEGAPLFKRKHPHGDPHDGYTLMPDGKPMGAERGKMPTELEGMYRLPPNHDEYVRKGWPSLERTNGQGEVVTEYQNFLNAEPVSIPAGTKIYRVVDEVAENDGGWWAFELPKNKTEWRRDYAVKDGWNDDGYYAEYVVPEGGLKAWSGKAAGQEYREYDGSEFYLPGGKEQIYIEAGSIEPSSPKLTNWPEP